MSELNKKNDKLISMMAAIDALCHRCDLVSDGTPCTEKCNDIKILEMLPSAQPEQKKGKWIDYSDDGYVECPFCRSATNCDDNIDELHYCFSCGAKMEGHDE